MVVAFLLPCMTFFFGFLPMGCSKGIAVHENLLLFFYLGHFFSLILSVPSFLNLPLTAVFFVFYVLSLPKKRKKNRGVRLCVLFFLYCNNFLPAARLCWGVWDSVHGVRETGESGVEWGWRLSPLFSPPWGDGVPPSTEPFCISRDGVHTKLQAS